MLPLQAHLFNFFQSLSHLGIDKIDLEVVPLGEDHYLDRVMTTVEVDALQDTLNVIWTYKSIPFGATIGDY